MESDKDDPSETYIKYAMIPVELLSKIVGAKQMRELSKHTLTKSTSQFIEEELIHIPTYTEINYYIQTNPNRDIAVVSTQTYEVFSNITIDHEDIVSMSTKSDEYSAKNTSRIRGDTAQVRSIIMEPRSDLMIRVQLTSDEIISVLKHFATVIPTGNPRKDDPDKIIMYFDLKTIVNVIFSSRASQLLVDQGHYNLLNEHIKEFCLRVLDEHARASSVSLSGILLHMHCVAFDIQVDNSLIIPFYTNTDQSLADSDLDIIDIMYQQLAMQIQDQKLCVDGVFAG